MGRLNNKRAFITGAAHGIGAAGAEAFAREGAVVICTDIDMDGLQAVVDRIGAAGGVARAVRCDIGVEDDIRASIAWAREQLGGLDIVWANAGAGIEGRAADISMETWQRGITLNLTSAWLTAKYALPHLIDSGKGSLIFTASTAGIRGSPNVAAYAAAKAGVIGLARQIAMDYAPDNIRANVVLPGTSRTRMLEDAYAKRAEQLNIPKEQLIRDTESGFPLKRLGAPEDHANLALFFASDESSWMTGHAIAVDGGRFAKF